MNNCQLRKWLLQSVLGDCEKINKAKKTEKKIEERKILVYVCNFEVKYVFMLYQNTQKHSVYVYVETIYMEEFEYEYLQK